MLCKIARTLALTAYQHFKFAALVAVIGVAGARSASAELVSHWKGENNALDSVGANHGTVHGTVNYVPGVEGSAFLFPDDGYIDFGNPMLDSSGSVSGFTFAAWYRFDGADAPPFGGPGAIAEYGSSVDGGFRISQGGSNHIWFTVTTIDEQMNPKTNGFITGLPFWFLGEVYHLAATYDAASHTMSLYQNGVLVESRNDLDPNSVLGNSQLATLEMGRHSETDARFEGMLDDIRLYNHALSASEIAALVPEPTGISALGVFAILAISSARRKKA